MARYGPGLEKQQLLLARYVNIATELLTISLSASRAHALGDSQSIETARYIAKRGIRRCETLFDDSLKSPDSQGYRLAQQLMR